MWGEVVRMSRYHVGQAAAGRYGKPHYADTIERHMTGHAGEAAVELWLRTLGITSFGWRVEGWEAKYPDHVAWGIPLEIKTWSAWCYDDARGNIAATQFRGLWAKAAKGCVILCRACNMLETTREIEIMGCTLRADYSPKPRKTLIGRTKGRDHVLINEPRPLANLAKVILQRQQTQPEPPMPRATLHLVVQSGS